MVEQVDRWRESQLPDAAAKLLIYRAFVEERYSRVFDSEEARARVVAAYMGLVAEIDDNLGRLLDFLEERAALRSSPPRA